MRDSFVEVGKNLLASGRVADALDCFDKQLHLEPCSQDSRLLRAMCLARLKRAPEAAEVVAALVEEDPNNYDGLTLMANLTRDLKQLDEGVEWAKKAIAVDGNRPEAHGALGTCCLQLGQAEAAVEALETAVRLAPDVARYRYSLAVGYGRLHRHRQAVDQMRATIRLAPGNPDAYASLSFSLMRLGSAGEAADAAEEGLRIAAHSVALHSAAAAAYTVLRDEVQAEQHHLAAARQSPEGAVAFAQWLVEHGRFDRAGELYDQLIVDHPKMGAAYYGLLHCRKDAWKNASLVAQMETALLDPAVAPHSKMYLCFGLGLVRERMQEFETAIERYDEANRLALDTLKFTSSKFDVLTKQAEGDRAIQCYETLTDRGVTGSARQSPILIVGMPRSGTTLLDQILGAHPQVSSAGELRFWIETGSKLAMQMDLEDQNLDAVAQEYLALLNQVGRNRANQSDKMPGNYLYAGLIHRTLPNARLIHMRRHPVDTCLSVFTTFLGSGGPMPYRRRDILDYYREYSRVMAYWREHLPANRLLEVEYETLVSNPEPVIRSVLEFCDLPWDDSCLRHEQNNSAINTPSRWQARQPIYQSSVSRWKNFEPWLGEFATLLPPRPQKR